MQWMLYDCCTFTLSSFAGCLTVRWCVQAGGLRRRCFVPCSCGRTRLRQRYRAMRTLLAAHCGAQTPNKGSCLSWSFYFLKLQAWFRALELAKRHAIGRRVSTQSTAIAVRYAWVGCIHQGRERT